MLKCLFSPLRRLKCLLCRFRAEPKAMETDPAPEEDKDPATSKDQEAAEVMEPAKAPPPSTDGVLFCPDYYYGCQQEFGSMLELEEHKALKHTESLR